MKMTWLDRWELRWMGIGTLILAALIGIWINWNNALALALSIVSVAFTTLILLSRRKKQRPYVMWDEQRGILAIMWSFSLEVMAGRLMTSVPIGIDLTRSASKVLRALHTRFEGKKKGEVRFFVCRPLGDGVTRAGMIVARRCLRLHDGVRKASIIAEKLATDAMVLESSMRAAYPHMPIERAGLEDLLMVSSGGIEPYAQVR